MRERMNKEEISYNNKRKLWFDRIYPLLRSEELTKDQVRDIGLKISELAIHLINNNNGNKDIDI